MSSTAPDDESPLDLFRSNPGSPMGFALAGVVVAITIGYFFMSPWAKNFIRRLGSTTTKTESLAEPQPDGKERDLLNYVLEKATKGDPKSVTDTIDAFCWSTGRMMHVGDEKGGIVAELIRAKNPKVAVELGGYCGYSAVRFASQLAEDAIYISIEMSSTHAAVARQVVEHAGLSHKVKIVVDETEIVLNNFKNRTGRAKIDFLFIDHEKKLYLRDIKTIVDKDLLESGAMVVADNVITPGAPDYLAWMRANLSFKSQLRKTKQAYNRDGEDGLEVSVYH